jgi:hypothetical protein
VITDFDGKTVLKHPRFPHTHESDFNQKIRIEARHEMETRSVEEVGRPLNQIALEIIEKNGEIVDVLDTPENLIRLGQYHRNKLTELQSNLEGDIL